MRQRNIDIAEDLLKKNQFAIVNKIILYKLIKGDNNNNKLFNQQKKMKKLSKKYVELLMQAEKASGRKEAVGLIHKAAKIKNKYCDINKN